MIAPVVLAVTMFANMPLAKAQTQALAISPDVAIAKSKVDEQRALFEQARATYGPAVTGNYVEGPQGSPQGTIAQRLTTVGAAVTLGDLLAYSPALAQANANLRAAEFDYAGAQRTERRSVIHLYFTALAAGATVSARQEALRNADAQLRAAQLRFSSGDAPRLDVVRAEVAQSQAQADLATSLADQRNAYGVLETETGAPDADLQQLSQLSTQTAQPVPNVADAVGAALERRSEVASARANVAAEEHAVAVARRGTFPAVTLAGGYTTGVDSGFPVSGPSATATVSVPVGGEAHARASAEEARLVQAQAQLEKARRDVVNEVSSAVRTLAAQSASLSAADRAVEEAAAELRATELGYRNGAGSSLDVETARATYTQAHLQQISAVYAEAEAQAALSLLMGQ